MLLDRVAAFVLGIFTKPFRGLSVFVWLILLLSSAQTQPEAMHYGQFMDSDDALHITRVWEWLGGQGWLDPHLYRILPPDGMVTHFSRLAELPLALFLWPMREAGLDFLTAAFATMVILPCVLLACFLALAKWAVRPVVGDEWAGVSAISLFFAFPLVGEFTASRADHHSLSVLCLLAVVGFVCRLVQEPSRSVWALGAGISCALAQAVALETFPCVIALSGFVGLHLVVKGKELAKNAALFGVTHFGFSALFLMLLVPPAQYFVMDSLTYSGLYVVLNALIAGVFLLLAGAAPFLGCGRRLALAALLGGGALAVFLTLFPSMLAGPFGSMDKDLADILLSFLTLNVPMAQRATSILGLIHAMILPIVAVVASFIFMLKQEDDRIWFWFGYGMILLGALIGTIFYQQRIAIFAHTLAILPFTLLVRTLWAVSMSRLREGVRVLPLFVLLFSMDAGLTLLQKFLGDKPPETPLAARPYFFTFADPKAQDPSVWQVLADPTKLGDRPRLIMNMMNECGPLLLFTHHPFLAAPYHTNVGGNLDSLSFFKTRQSDVAREIVKRRGVDLVLVSPRRAVAYSQSKIKGEAHVPQTPDFSEQLVAGQVPDWLRRVPASEHNDQFLFEVVRERL